jgi:hypothetical protein
MPQGVDDGVENLDVPFFLARNRGQAAKRGLPDFPFVTSGPGGRLRSAPSPGCGSVDVGKSGSPFFRDGASVKGGTKNRAIDWPGGQTNGPCAGMGDEALSYALQSVTLRRVFRIPLHRQSYLSCITVYRYKTPLVE